MTVVVGTNGRLGCRFPVHRLARQQLRLLVAHQETEKTNVMRILLVEDIPVDRMFVTQSLQQLTGFQYELRETVLKA